MHRPAMVKLRLVQHAPHPRGFRAYQVHDALPLVVGTCPTQSRQRNPAADRSRTWVRSMITAR